MTETRTRSWTYDRTTADVTDEEDRDIAAVNDTTWTYEEADAHGHLLAAAPSLYAALEAASEFATALLMGPTDPKLRAEEAERVAGLALAALSKARGQP